VTAIHGKFAQWDAAYVLRRRCLLPSAGNSSGNEQPEFEPTETTKTETTSRKPPPGPARSGRRFVSLTSGGGCGIRTREGVNPTRSPSLPRPFSQG
jgi:hypothetical protein